VYTDRGINCLDCGQEFTFTSGEQEFYAQRGFTEPPKRCPSCRSIRKAQRNSGSAQGDSGSYSSGYERSGNGDGYGGGNGYGAAASRGPRQLFEAVCADCGKTAQLPFQPTGSRPVYCSDCFQGRRA
jgi:CxxC-x17-CxxC domain-containing protein